jgi:hypothetical protein
MEGQRKKIIGNDKVIPVRAMKAYRGSIDIDPPILNIGIFWR